MTPMRTSGQVIDFSTGMPPPDPAAGFLAAVLADPADDSARAAYADWLTERDDPRGEFIAVQLALAKCRDGAESCPPDSRCGRCMGCELRRRERELLAAHGRAWIAPVVKAVTGFPFGPDDNPGPQEAYDLGRFASVLWDPKLTQFRRGFVAHVTLTLADFESHAAALFGAAPLETVRLADREPLYSILPRRWYWYTPDVSSPGSDLPSWLFAALDGAAQRGRRYKGYATEDAAHAALSAACVAHGRRLAGLPPLARPGVPAKEAARV